jgi:hypothetical protein
MVFEKPGSEFASGGAKIRWIRPYVTGLLALVLVGLALLGSPRVVASGSGSSLDDPTTENLATDIASDGERLGALTAYWDSTTKEVVLVFPSSGPVISPLDLGDPGLGVRIERAAVTGAQLEQAKHEVVALAGDGTLKGATTEVSLNPQSGIVEITSTANKALFAGILASLGPGGVFLSGKGEITRFASRFNDFAPFWGGDKIYHVGTVNTYCSSGFAVLKSGTPYMITAGHCYSVGWNISMSSTVPYGTVAFRQWSQNGLDAELIGGQRYGGYIWRGRDSNGASFGQVVNAKDPLVPFNDYCSSGWHSLELCGLQSTGINILACDGNGQCSDKLARFAGDTHWLSGDSGGPIFAKVTSSTVGARANIVFAWNGSSYGQEWSSMASQWGLTICTVGDC